jgi:hypothetical protein
MRPRYISTVPLGSTVVCPNSLHNVIGDVISRQGAKTLIGFKEPHRSFGAWLIRDHYNFSMRGGSTSVPDIDDYAYGWWLIDCDLVKLVEAVILYPDQVCYDCKLPSPHAKPNVGNEFVCASCIVLRELV